MALTVRVHPPTYMHLLHQCIHHHHHMRCITIHIHAHPPSPPPPHKHWCGVVLQLLELAPAATCLTAALEPACCLDELVHRQAKLLDLAQHVLDGTTLAHLEALPAVPAMIKARETVCALV